MYGNGTGAMAGASSIAQYQAKQADAMNIGMGDAKRQAELPEQLDRLMKSVEYLLCSLNDVEQRLGPVMQPEPPQVTGNATVAPGGPTTGYAFAVYEQAQRITRIGERLQDMLRRLEL